MLLRFVRALEDSAKAMITLAAALNQFVDFFVTAEQEEIDTLTGRLKKAKENLKANLPTPIPPKESSNS